MCRSLRGSIDKRLRFHASLNLGTRGLRSSRYINLIYIYIYIYPQASKQTNKQGKPHTDLPQKKKKKKRKEKKREECPSAVRFFSKAISYSRVNE